MEGGGRRVAQSGEWKIQHFRVTPLPIVELKTYSPTHSVTVTVYRASWYSVLTLCEIVRGRPGRETSCSSWARVHHV